MTEYHSILKEEIKEFFELQVSNKAQYTRMHYRSTLEELDSYLGQTKAQTKELTKQQLDDWIRSLKGKPSTIQGKACKVRKLCRFLRDIGIQAADPDLPIVRQDYVAYHFTDAELERLYDWIDNLEIHYRKLESNETLFIAFPVIFRILLCCGTRIGETLSLKVGDIDFSSGCIHLLRNTKGKKQRIVPMHQDLTVILKLYCERIAIIHNPDSVLFPRYFGSETPIKQKTITCVFHTLLLRLGIASPAITSDDSLHERGPCIHCLRHAFAFRAFRQCESHGMAVNDMVPYLSYYLGHERLNETEKYLKFSPELQPETTDTFDSYSSSVFPEVL